MHTSLEIDRPSFRSQLISAMRLYGTVALVLGGFGTIFFWTYAGVRSGSIAVELLVSLVFGLIAAPLFWLIRIVVSVVRSRRHSDAVQREMEEFRIKLTALRVLGYETSHLKLTRKTDVVKSATYLREVLKIIEVSVFTALRDGAELANYLRSQSEIKTKS